MAFETGGEIGRPDRSLRPSANEKASSRSGKSLAKSVTGVTPKERVAVGETVAICTDTKAKFANIRAHSRGTVAGQHSSDPWNVPWNILNK